MQANNLLAPLMQRSEVVVTGIVIAHTQNNELSCAILHGIIVPGEGLFTHR
jgi:hypothetical protein